VATYVYDGQNRPGSANFGGHSFAFTYDSLGRRTALNRSSGANTGYGYEADDDLASISHAFAAGSGQPAASFTYGRDAAGRITAIDHGSESSLPGLVRRRSGCVGFDASSGFVCDSDG
jgi:YD repeat-containing protein